MYVTFVMDINVRYILNFIFIWIFFYFNMINSKSKIKKVLVIRESGIGDPWESPVIIRGKDVNSLK